MVVCHNGLFALSKVATTIRANLPAFGVSARREVPYIGTRRPGSRDAKVRRAD